MDPAPTLPTTPEDCYQALRAASDAELAPLLAMLRDRFPTRRARSRVRDDLIERAKTFARRGRAEQARRCILGALAVDLDCVGRIERELVVPYDLALGNVGTEPLLAALLRDPDLLDACSPGAADRMRSYQNLVRIEKRFRQEFYRYRRSLEHRPYSFVRAVLTLAEVIVFSQLDRALDRLLPGWLRNELDAHVASAETFLEVLSAMLAEANTLRPISRDELSAPAAPYLFSPEFLALLGTAQRRHIIRTVRDAISLTNHSFSRIDQESRELYLLRPRDPMLARAHWCGSHFRGMQNDLRMAGMEATTDNSVFLNMKQRTLAPEELACAPRPYPRHRFFLPDLADIGWDKFDDVGSIEDARVARQDEELVLPDLLLDRTIVGGMPLRRAMIFYRRMTLLGFIHCAKIANLAATATDEALANSLVRVVSADELATLLGEGSRGALPIWSWCGQPGRFDLQYTPLVRSGEDIALAPALLCISLGLRNALIHRHDRPREIGQAFVDELRALLETRFSHVAVTRRVDVGDVDLAVLDGSTLWIFECKFNIYPTGAFEQRAVLADLEEATAQLRRVEGVLQSDPHLLSRLRTWFPGATRVQCRIDTIRCGIIASVRELGGLTICDIPVRDYFSLRNLLQRGYLEARVVGPGQPEERRKIPVWRGTEFCPADFADFWSPSSTYHAIRTESIAETTGFMQIAPDLTLAREAWTWLPE